MEESSIRAAVDFRPLGIGEIFDRAVSLSVTSFIALAAIYIVYAIPVTVVQYFVTPDLSKVLAAIAAAAKGAPNAGPATIAQALAIPPQLAWLSAVYIVFSLLLYPLPTGALMWTIAKIYTTGRAPRFADAYRHSLECWGPLLLLGLMWLVCAMIAYILVLLIFVVVTLLAAAVSVLSNVAGIALGVVIGVPLLIAFMLVLIVGLLAATTSFLEVVVERRGFITAFGAALQRIFLRSFVRSLWMSLALAAIGVGLWLMGALVEAAIVGLLHSQALSVAFSGVLRVINVVFLTTAITIYYYDVLVRTEGFDLELSAASADDAVPATN